MGSLVCCLFYVGYEQTPATNGTSHINCITCQTRLGIHRLHFNHAPVSCVCVWGGGGGGGTYLTGGFTLNQYMHVSIYSHPVSFSF